MYFGSLCVGALAYWLDLHYNSLDFACKKIPCVIGWTKRAFVAAYSEAESWSHEHWMAILITVLLGVIAYQVYEVKVRRIRKDEEEDEPLDLVPTPSEMPSWGLNKPPVVSVS